MLGYQVREEVCFGNFRLDIVAFKDSRVLGFEVKLHSWGRALQQVQIYKLCCDEVYVALPSANLASSIEGRCLTGGVGLVTLGPPPDWEFSLILEAPLSRLKNPLHHANIQQAAAFI
jgi:hypothetical protein